MAKKCVGSWDSAPNPAGELTALQDLLAGLRGKQRGTGKEGRDERRGGRGGEEEKRGKRERGRGRGWPQLRLLDPPLSLPKGKR